MRLVACLGLCLLLSGCSGLTDMFDTGSDANDDTVQAEAAPAPAPVAAPDDGFCRNVAAYDSSASHGYDQATQVRVAQLSYAQCRANFAR